MFQAAEDKINELDTRVASLEAIEPVDLTALMAEIAATKDAIAALDTRLDAIATAAQG